MLKVNQLFYTINPVILDDAAKTDVTATAMQET
jgi:hypothetical protein